MFPPRPRCAIYDASMRPPTPGPSDGRVSNVSPARPTAAASSKARFRDFLARQRAGKTIAPSAEEDPNSPRKVKRTRSFLALFRAFWVLVRVARTRILLCIITVTFSALLALAMPASTKIAIDYILSDHPGPAGLPDWVPTRDPKMLLWLLGGALMVLNMLSIVNSMIGRFQMTRLTHLLRARIRRKVFAHAVRLPLHRVYQIKSGGAASFLREDAGQSADLLFSMIYNPWRAVVQLSGTLIILAWTDWRLLVGALTLIPAAWFTQKTWIGRIRPVQKAVRATRASIDAHATEAFGGMRVVRAFSRWRGESGRFIRANYFMSRQELMVWWWSRTIEMLWQFLLPLGSAAVLVYGGYRVVDGTLTLGDVMMFSAYLIMLLGPLESLSGSATSIQAELASLDRVLDLLNEPTEFQRESEKQVAPVQSVDFRSISGRVTFQNVSFRYPGVDEWVLRNIDLDVPAGATIALVGPSGAGKTTLCNLVARFYDPTEGAILIDGIDLRSLDVDAYRRLLGIVEQDVFLFDGSVRDNIAYSRRGVDLEHVRAAARAANADGFIQRLEHGYDTLIGERGVRLSGGQKQRIAIARALLADPRILILDEATSNLDTESESLIQESLRVLMRSRTSFVIAHRLSTIRNADRIIVLDRGRIAEMGTHAELLAREGRYWQMLTAQAVRKAEREDEWTIPGSSLTPPDASGGPKETGQ